MIASISDRSYKFFAFISYSHKDAALAKQMDNAFTRFNLPAELCEKYPQKPKKIRPIFRDANDLKSGVLSAGLEQALRDSKHLVVICSEHSAKNNSKGKNWIDEEVKTFILVLAEDCGLGWGEDKVNKLLELLGLLQIKEQARLEAELVSFCKNNAVAYDDEQLQRWSTLSASEPSKWTHTQLADFAGLMGYSDCGEGQISAIKTFFGALQHRIIPVLHRPSSLGSLLGFKKKPRSADCMPPTIRKLNFLAYDIQEQGKWRVFNNSIATMLGLELDELWNRYGKWLRLKQRIKYCTLVTASLALLGGGLYAYDYYVPKVEYYIDFVERYNIPEGLGELSEDELKNRFYYYRFTYQYHKLQSVETCNAVGALTDEVSDIMPQKRTAKIVFTRYEGDVLTESCHYDANGKLVARVSFPDLNTIEYKRTIEEGDSSYTLSSDDGSLNSESLTPESSEVLEQPAFIFHANKRIVKRNADGFITEEKSYRNDVLCPNRDMVWGYTYEPDDMGRVVKRRYIDEHGRPMSSSGVYGNNYEYSGFYITKTCTVDQAGNERAKDGQRASGFLVEWKNGKFVSQSCRDADNNLTYSPEIGAAALAFQYHPDNRIKSISFRNEKGDRVDSNITKHCEQTWDYDFQDGLEYVTEKSYNATKLQVGNTNRYTMDKNKRVFMCSSLDEEGKFKASKIYYDSEWNIKKQSEYSAENKLKGSVNYMYKEGKLVGVYYTDENDAPCKGEGDYSKLSIAIDDFTGEPSMVAYFDELGNPCKDSAGIARYTITYEPMTDRTIRKRMILEKISDSDPGKLIPYRQQIVVCDNRGYIIGMEFRDGLGNLVAQNPQTGIAKVTINRQEGTIMFLGKDGNPVSISKNISDCLASGKAIERLCCSNLCSLVGNPVLTYSGVKRKTEYLSNGGCRKTCILLGRDGKPCVASGQVCGVIFESDIYGRVTMFAFCDGQENIKEKTEYFADTIYRTRYSQNNLLTWESYTDLSFRNFKVGPKGYAVHCITHDDAGNVLEESYYSARRQRTVGPDGYSVYQCERDAEGRVTEEYYYDVNGCYCDGPGGYAFAKRRYDAEGNVTDEVYADESLIKKDSRGNVSEIRFRDAHGKLRGTFEGVYHKVFEWDEQGENLQRVLNYDEGGNLILEPAL